MRVEITIVGSVSWSIPRTLLKLNGTPTSGAVAQLGERLVRNEEATGSIPVSSTMFPTTYVVRFRKSFSTWRFLLDQ